ncbi:MAG: hypothetical protein Q8L74_04895 [Nitrospirota bacterium]|nr:hypothetical protein [Nitrospirota bacterium]
MAPRLLPVCCVCARIRDEEESHQNLERWVSPRTFRRLHGMNPNDFPLTHTYCPMCFMRVQKEVQQYLKTIGRPS